MKKIFKSVFSYLLICMLFCCPITNVYADEINTRIVSAEAMTISANNTYYILKKTEVPTVIVECGFLSNYKEAQKLVTEDYQKSVAEAVAEGILSYIKENE